MLFCLPLLATSYQYTDSTGTIQVVETKEEVPPRYRRSMKMISEDSHSAIGVESDKRSHDDLDVRDVIDEALAKKRAEPGEKIVTFEALAKKKGETPPTVKEIQAQARQKSGDPVQAQGVAPSDDGAKVPPWTGFLPLLAGIALAFIGIARLQGFMRLTSIGLGLVLSLLGFAKAFPESMVAKQVNTRVDEVVETTGTKKAFESARETVSKPFKAPLEVVGKTKDAIRQAEQAQKAKLKALDKLTEDD